MKYDFLPIIIEAKDRVSYYQSLDDLAVSGNLGKFYDLIFQGELDRLKEYEKEINS